MCLIVVILIGDAFVGKTCLRSCFMDGQMPKNPSSTIGVEFATADVRMDDGVTVKAQIWDTAG